MKRSLVLLLVLSLVLSFALVGCGGNAADTEETTEEATTEETTTEETTTEETSTEEATEEETVDNPAYDRGNVLTVATDSLKGKFNPILADDVYDMWVADAVFDGLIGSNPSGEVTTDGVAKSWEVSEDKLTYTFKLKEGVKFHDGEEMTSEDVEFTYLAIADPDYAGSRGPAVADIVGVDAYRNGEADTVEGIKVIDDYTISFTIKEPNVKKIRDFSYGIMPKHYYAFETWDEFTALNRKPVGTGVMKFKSFEVGQYCELETNPDYFKGAAKIDGVVIKMVPSETQPAAVASGDVDLANPSGNIENYETMVDTGIADVQEFLGNSYRYVGFNLRLDKFADKRVRQALAYGLNMDEYIETQWEGFAQACDSPISPISWAAPDASTLNKYDYNPEKAQELLAEAGWVKNDEGKLMKDGEQFTIEWTTYKESEWPINLIAVAENNWGELGIDVKSNVMEFNAVVTQVYDEQDFEVYNMGWSLAVDPDPYAIFHSDNDKLGGFNSIGFHNDRADEIIEMGRKEYDQAVRAELYQEWAQLANEELPYMFVSIGTVTWGVNDRVNNMELGPYWTWVDELENIELEY